MAQAKTTTAEANNNPDDPVLVLDPRLSADIQGDWWTMDDHKRCASDLRAWYMRVDYYVREVWEKKCVWKRTRHHPRSKAVGSLLDNWLFYGKRSRTYNDAFPSAFKCELESCMFRKFYGDPDCDGLYYGGDRRDPFPSGETAPEPLDDGPDLVPSDVQKIREMNERFVAFLDECIALARCHGRARRSNETFDRMVQFRDTVERTALRPLWRRRSRDSRDDRGPHHQERPGGCSV